MANDRRVAPATEASRDFRRSMFEMINHKDLSDMSITCKDKVSIRASRLQLMSRSSTLNSEIQKIASTFRFYPQEVNIVLPSITSTTLLFILEYLYTGQMFHKNGYQMKTVEQAVHIVPASRYLDLEPVERIVTAHLTDMISKAQDNISKAALELSASIELGVPASTSSPDLKKTLKKADLTPAHLRLLSLKAFEQYLEDTKRSHEEYTRFRQIILWCITQVRPKDSDDTIAKLLPDHRRAMDLLKRNSLVDGVLDGVNLKYFESLGRAARHEFNGLMKELLRQVELSRMSPLQLLGAVVAPLNVVPHMDNVINQARNAQINSPKPAPPKWVHGTAYKSEGDGGLTIAKCEPRRGLATYLKPISGNSGVYEWAITMLELCDEFCEIGFHKDGPTRGIGTVARQPMGFSLRSTRATALEGSEVNRVDQKGDKWKSFKGSFAHLNTRVKFKLDMEKRNCMIRVGDGKYELAWSELPKSSTFHPAVSLGTGKVGKVSIELIKGFN